MNNDPLISEATYKFEIYGKELVEKTTDEIAKRLADNFMDTYQGKTVAINTDELKECVMYKLVDRIIEDFKKG